MGVSKNIGTPKSSILMVFSIINHPFWGTPIFGNTHVKIHTFRFLNFSPCKFNSEFTPEKLSGPIGKDRLPTITFQGVC